MSKLQQAIDLLREYCACRGDDEFVDEVEAEIATLIAQAEAWKTMLHWVCHAESQVDANAREMYAMRLLDGEPFEDWYDDVAGRPPGYNAPPKGVLMVLRPYIFGSVMVMPNVRVEPPAEGRPAPSLGPPRLEA